MNCNVKINKMIPGVFVISQIICQKELPREGRLSCQLLNNHEKNLNVILASTKRNRASHICLLRKALGSLIASAKTSVCEAFTNYRSLLVEKI